MVHARILTWALIAGLTLAACTIAPVQLRHPQTGQTARCGPYTYWSWGYFIARDMERSCVEDFQKAGYQRAGQEGVAPPVSGQRWHVVATDPSGKPETLGVPQESMEGCRALREPLGKLYPDRKLACEIER